MARPKAIHLDDLETVPDERYTDVTGKLVKSFRNEAEHIRNVVHEYWKQPENVEEGFCVWRFDTDDAKLNARMAEGAAKWIESQRPEGGSRLKARTVRARGRGKTAWLIIGSNNQVLDRRQEEFAIAKVQLPADAEALAAQGRSSSNGSATKGSGAGKGAPRKGGRRKSGAA